MMKTRNKIAFLLGGVIVIFAVYLSFTVSPILGASLLVILPFLLCPIACGVVGGVMWFSNRSKKQRGLKEVDKKNQRDVARWKRLTKN